MLTDPPPPSEPQGRARTRVLFAVKLLVTLGLITWLVRSGGLNFKTLSLLWSSPIVAASVTINFLFGVMFCSTSRWRVLLSALGVQVSLRRALGLQATALFFNYYVPGNVSGDLIKNYAVIKRDTGRLVTLALVDRITGLIGLIWAAVPALLWSGSDIAQHEEGFQLVCVVVFLLVMSVVGPMLLYYVLPESDTPSAVTADGHTWAKRIWIGISGHLRSGTSTLRILLKNPRALLTAIGISQITHYCAIVNCWIIARHIENPDATLSQVALVYPIGIMSVAIPISISGMGVGHVLFNQLFKMIGLVRGADVFNVCIFSGFIPSTFGVIPYLLMRRERSADIKSS